MNPTVQVSITRTFEAEHSLPQVGVAKPHSHAYSIECGYEAAIDTELGCTRPMQEVAGELDAVIARIAGRNLNEVLPVTPTAEMLGCWVLAQLPDTWQWVSIRAYEGFMCKVERVRAAAFIAELRAAESARVSSSAEAQTFR
jgi:6-pyruvoyl-tetrahydropterin synthase